MFFQLTLALVLLALPGSQELDDDCTVNQRRDVRLRGGTEYAGRVEVCWSEYSGTSYKWWSVCTDMWGIDEARAVCQNLNYTNSKVIGTAIVMCAWSKSRQKLLHDYNCPSIGQRD